jgi:Anti-sigma-28 factor, FlgM
MDDALRQAIASGDYRVDVEAVAVAMIARAQALRSARRSALRSEMLVAVEGIEIRRLGADKAEPCSLEGAA